MDNWNENNQNVSVSGQFNVPNQDVQGAQSAEQNSVVEPVQPAGYNLNGTYTENTQASYGQPYAENSQTGYGQPYAENSQTGYGQPAGNSQLGYGQPYPNYNQGSYQGADYTPVEKEDPVKMGEWMLLLGLTTFVPCVGWILALVWAFSKTEKQSKVNFCKAYMIIWLIKLALGMIFFIIYGAIFASVLAEL